MKCRRCSGTLVETREAVPYLSLPGAQLLNVPVRRCDTCDYHEVAIPAIEKLDRLLAKLLIGKTSPLLPSEARFLRKHPGWSVEDCAERMGIREEDVASWEREGGTMPLWADHFLRVLVACETPTTRYRTSSLRLVKSEPASALVMRVRPSDGGWMHAA